MKRIVIAATLLFALPLHAATTCRMTFNLKGWSAFYKTAKGTGKITCENGQTADVKVRTKGGGLTFGKSKMAEGTGKFTPVDDISELFGSYAEGEANAGAGHSAHSAVVTKGEISLTLAGKGTGVEVGVSFGKFTIEKK